MPDHRCEPVIKAAVDDPNYLGTYFQSHPNQATAAELQSLTPWYI